jgi:Caspase domain
MRTLDKFRVGLLAVFCCAAVVGWPDDRCAAEKMPGARSQVTVMIMVQGPGQERSHVVENTLAQVFLRQGYKVIDAAAVTQSLRRNTYLLKQAETEAAKRLGSGLGADIVISGEARSRVVDKTYTLFEGKKVILGQADVTVKAVLSKSGRVIVAENASRRKPFDTTGQIALQLAAEEAASKLIHGIEQFATRDTTDYRLVILNVDDSQSLAFQDSLRNRLKGVRQVDEYSSKPQVSELTVKVEKDHDLPFKQSLYSELSGFGIGPLQVVGREGETIYLQKADSPMTPTTKPDTAPDLVPPSNVRISPSTIERASRPAPADAATRTTSTEGPPDGLTWQKPTYRKSWAVLIGINEYQKWPKLQYAVNDARAVETLVRELGFDEVIVILDGQATRQQILRILGDELYTKTQEDDRVFIFYAGHGQTQDLPDNAKDGFIIPVDGEAKDYYSTAISMLQLQGLADRTRAKHMFYAIDACFSGVLQRMRLVPREKTRQVLTAGSEGEQAVEMGGHGLFTKSLLEGLAGAADRANKGYITATELHDYVAARVMVESRNFQNPVFGRLDSGRGEFVFIRK